MVAWYCSSGPGVPNFSVVSCRPESFRGFVTILNKETPHLFYSRFSAPIDQSPGEPQQLVDFWLQLCTKTKGVSWDTHAE